MSAISTNSRIPAVVKCILSENGGGVIFPLVEAIFSAGYVGGGVLAESFSLAFGWSLVGFGAVQPSHATHSPRLTIFVNCRMQAQLSASSRHRSRPQPQPHCLSMWSVDALSQASSAFSSVECFFRGVFLKTAARETEVDRRRAEERRQSESRVVALKLFEDWRRFELRLLSYFVIFFLWW